MDPTSFLRWIFSSKVREVKSWCGRESAFQQKVLANLLRRAKDTVFGRANGFADILARPGDLYSSFVEAVPMHDYEGFRDYVMRMMRGERDVLWPGLCRNFAQSSGTTGGRSKFIPVTEAGLRENHYKGASYSVALYLAANRASRMFSGKGLILGGSFSSTVEEVDKGVVVGDLSATLIQRVNPFVNFFRVPDKKTALLPDWQVKLPLIAAKAAATNLTNLSGVPSWMLQVLLRVLEIKGASSLSEVWPHLEVFFHGGISFAPYREEYGRLCRGLDMHFAEVFNASEGYFACSEVPTDLNYDPLVSGIPSMLLLVDAGVFFEFLPLGCETPVGVDGLKVGKVYELVVSTVNGLWRYRIGDTVRIEGLAPLSITVAGRTKSFINAFGEELMEDNAERAIAEACRATGASVLNYTVAPVYAHGKIKGRHQWLIEWKEAPASLDDFTRILDDNLRRVNSDYDAKRAHDIFLDVPEIVSLPDGAFHGWLATVGSGKLGGQRKVPRLSNDRSVADAILSSP